MEEEPGEGTIDSYDDFLNGVTLSARGKEEMDINKGPVQLKAGEKIPADMGARVKKARENRGLSIFDLYLRSDIDVVTLSQIEEGEVVPPLGTVIKLAKALDLKMGYFISGEEANAYTIVRRDDRKVTPR